MADGVPSIDTHLRLLHAVVKRRHFADRQHCAILVAEITAALFAKRDAIPALAPCDRWGLTPLELAAYSGDVQLVRQLFDMYDDTPATVLRMLPWAVRSGSASVVRHLVAAYQRQTPLSPAIRWELIGVACRAQHVRVVEALLGSHADFDPSARLHIAPLHTAALAGDVLLVQLLLEFGADTTDPTAPGPHDPVHVHLVRSLASERVVGAVVQIACDTTATAQLAGLPVEGGGARLGEG